MKDEQQCALKQLEYTLRLVRCVDPKDAFLGRNKHSLLRLHVHVQATLGPRV